MLKEIAIQNYRTFNDFHIDGLATVNLIVGMNNTGKTSLLEAIYLLVNPGRLQCLFELLKNRNEIVVERSTRLSGEALLRRSYQVLHIFNGHNLKADKNISIQSHNENLLSFQVQLHPVSRQLSIFEDPETENDFINSELIFSYDQNMQIEVPVRADGSILDIRSSRLARLSRSEFHPSSISESLFLTTSNMSFEFLASLWDKITLTPKEEIVIKALQILEPNVERISFTSRQGSNNGVLLKLKSQNNPIPLGSMGDGIRRILTLVASAVTVENGYLFVDEIDTGLHYQTQTDMWRLVLEVAKELNIQVFATTHSWDCITSFQEALIQSKDYSIGKLFRLSRQNENIHAVEYTPEELSIAVRQSIEVR